MITANVVLVLLIASFGFVASTPTFASTDGTFRANWTISGSSITFMMSGLGTGGWVGIGWNMNGGMPNSDVVVGWIDNANRVTVVDRWASTRTTPSTDTSLGGTNDVSGIKGYVETYNGAQWTTFIFTRPLNSGDSHDFPIINSSMHMIYAVGASGSVNYNTGNFRQHSSRGDVIVNFFEPNVAVVNAPIALTPITVVNATGSGTTTFASSDGSFRANWTISSSSITFMMSGLGTSGWVGMGWNMNGGMPNSDVVVGWIDNTNAVVLTDQWASDRIMPSTDTSLGGTNDVTNIQGYVETFNGAQWTTFIFTRPLNSGDTNDVPITNTAMHMIYAVGSTGSVDYTTNTFQQHLTQGDVIVNFFDTTAVITTPPVSSASGSTPVAVAVATNSTNNNLYASPDGTFKVKWAINQSNITFTISGTTSTGWVGIGWNSNGGMPKSDMVVGWVDNTGAAVVFDSWASDQSMPSQDTSLGGDSYVSNVSASIDKINNVKWMTITFTRPLDVTDKYDVAITNQQMHMIWAVGSDGSVNYATKRYSQHSTQGDVLINFFSGNTLCGSNAKANNVFFKVHAVLMVVGWTMMLFVGTFIARYLKPLTKNWFKAHVALQTIGCVVVLVAFALVLIYYNGGFTVGWHQLVGIAVIAGMVVQPIIGGIADKMYDPSRSKVPIWPDQIHWWIGRITSVVALAAIFLGIREYMPDSLVAYILFGAYCFLTFIIILVAELKAGSKHENEIYSEDMTVMDGVKVEKRKVLVARNLFVAWIVIGFLILIAFMIFIVLNGTISGPLGC